MAEHTKIEWCDHTINFWIGCQEVSPACDHCYAREQNAFRGWVSGWGPDGERRRTAASTWHQLRTWNAKAVNRGVRARVFANSLSDFFDNAASYVWRREAWHFIEQCGMLDFLILTKRPQNIRKMLPDPETGVKPWGDGWPNVWLGTTVENQQEADRRIPHLLAVPAAVRFLSCEPLLGPVDLGDYIGRVIHAVDSREAELLVPGRRIDWVICGGESGKNARPMHPDWARSLRGQCAAAGVPFFFKQWGEWAPSTPEAARGNPRSGWRCLAGHPHVPKASELYPENGAAFIERVGKKAAGTMLDGRGWRQVPQ